MTTPLADDYPLLAPSRTNMLPTAGYAGAVFAPRASDWDEFRLAFVLKNPRCLACGARRLLNVHHLQPFHQRPDLEKDEANCAVLCEGYRNINCHLWFGHGGNWASWVPDAVRRAEAFYDMVTNRHGVPWKDKR